MQGKVEICGVNTAHLKTLKNDEMVELLRRSQAGDQAARERLIEGNLRLVLSVIQRFLGRGENPDDLFQVGCVGLLKAIANFDVNLNVRFSTYGVPMIAGEIRRYLRDNSAIRVSRSMRDTAYRVLQCREAMQAEQSREPTLEEVARRLELPLETVDFTLPAAREETYAFTDKDLVIFGTPTYAGKVPNKLLPFVQTGFAGNGALAVPVVTFGNRSFDNSLAELCASLENAGFHTIAAGAFACQHAFSDTLAAGRPDREDMTVLAQLGAAVVTKLGKMTEIPAPVQVDGDADAPYYRPLGLDGEPKNFLKAKPQTDRSKCTGCGVCAALCPMGSISREDPAEVTGVCIKCHACVRNCPTGAKYFDDEAFLSHKAMLERDYTRRAEDKIFL